MPTPAAGRSRCPCSSAWPTTWSRCTGRPTSSSCSSPAGSARRSTGSPGRISRRCWPSYQRVYQRHRDVRAELDQLTSQAREREREADDLRRGLAEIEQAEPADGEDVELLAEEQRLSHADALHSAATTAHEALLGDPSSGQYDAADAVTLLGAARQALEAAAQHDAAIAAARRPGLGGGLPGLRRRGRPRVLRAVGRGGPGTAGRRAGAAGNARAPDPAVRRGTAGTGQRRRPSGRSRSCETQAGTR